MSVRERYARWRAKPVTLRFWREFLIICGFDLVYEWTSDYAGTSRSAAYKHALQEVRIEHDLGLLQEHTIQAWALHSKMFIELADLFYATVHFIMPVLALLVLFRYNRERYLRWRDTLAWTTAMALVCFAVFPLMPPRMLPARYGVIDTMAKIGGLGSWDTVLLKDAGNQFAAMPSLHISWALWSVLALYPFARRWWIKALLILDTPVTVVVILVTGNHYVLDIFGGLAVLGLGWLLSGLRPRYLPSRVVVPNQGPATTTPAPPTADGEQIPLAPSPPTPPNHPAATR